MKARRRRALWAVVGWLVAGCGAAPPPDVLLISVDTLRPDHLGCYGYGRDTSPHLDALARRGAVFDNALSTSSWTLPAHASLLTGLYPSAHGLRDDGYRLPDRVATLAEALRARGYATRAVVSHVYASSEFGLERGFEVFDDSLIRGGAANPIAEPVVDRALELIDEAGPGPVFAFVHLFDPHWGYTPPPPFDARFTDPGYRGPIDGAAASMWPFLDRPMPDPDRRQLIAYYDGEIAYLDAQLGRLFAGLARRGRLDRTLVVFTADHGEEFKEHGRLGHGRTLFGEQLRVPLVLAGHPAFPPESRRRDFATLADVAPTLLELAGAPVPDSMVGRSLLRVAPDERALFAESIRFGVEIRSVQRGPHKLIHYLQGGERFYFDLVLDPAESRPLARDPAGGVLDAALAEFAAAADHGWHLKLHAPDGSTLRALVRVRTSGRIVDPRRYFSGQVTDSLADFSRFELAADGSALDFEVAVRSHLGEVTFETEPRDAEVELEISLASDPAGARVFLGSDAGPLDPQSGPIRLRRDDPRVHDPAPFFAPAGLYVRAVDPPDRDATRLSPEALERLRALGYTDAGGP